MKFIRYIVFLFLTLSFLSTKVRGHNTPGDDDKSWSQSKMPVNVAVKQDTVKAVEETADDIKEEAKTVNVPHNKIELRDKSGAISVLNPDEYINTAFSSSLYDGITGRVGGLLGASNIWGIGGAILIIDGVQRDFYDIRLEEVEQVTVLKGANAVALFGSRAAAGVILVTTKRGKVGERELKVRLNSGIASPKRYPAFLNSAEYMTLYNEARTNDGLEAAFDEELIENYRSGNPYRYPDVDYYSSDYLTDYVYNTDIMTDFSGGNENAVFYANIGLVRNTSLLNYGEGRNENELRFNARGNADVKINKYISSSLDFSTVITDVRRARVNYWNSAATILPHKYSPFLPLDQIHPDSANVMALAENSGNIIDDQYIFGGSPEYLENPIADMYAGGYTNYVRRIMQVTNQINVDLDALVDGLTFHTLFHTDYYNSFEQSIDNDYSVYTPVWDSVPDSETIIGLEKHGDDVHRNELMVGNSSQVRNLGFSSFFKYQRTFEDVHNFSGMLLGNGTIIRSSNEYQPYTNSNIGIQLGYNYDHKYWVDFSGALVNSTMLPENNRTAFSPTIALGWLLSEEAFLEGVDVINRLKLSASAGIINTDITMSDFYLYDNTYTQQAWFGWGDALYANQATTSLQGANPDLSFTKRNEFNATIEGSFFDQVLALEASYFNTTFAGMPTRRFSQYPSYYETFVPYTNFNSNRVSGVDFAIGVKKGFGDFKLDAGLYGMYMTTKVVERDEIYVDVYQERKGKPTDAIFGLENDGFFMNDADIESHPDQAFGEVRPGDIKYVDQNDDGIINERDEVQIGRWSAPLTTALNLSLSYKNLTLFVQLRARSGGYGLKSGDYFWVDGDNKYSEVVLDRWTEETSATATYPRLSSAANNNNFRTSDFWLYKTDMLGLSRVQLTYAFPDRLFENAFIKDFQIYVNGSNLLTISENKDIIDLNVYGVPQMWFLNAGILANF